MWRTVRTPDLWGDSRLRAVPRPTQSSTNTDIHRLDSRERHAVHFFSRQPLRGCCSATLPHPTLRRVHRAAVNILVQARFAAPTPQAFSVSSQQQTEKLRTRLSICDPATEETRSSERQDRCRRFNPIPLPPVGMWISVISHRARRLKVHNFD